MQAAYAQLVPVNYTHDGDDLQGFKVIPNATGKSPALVLIPYVSVYFGEFVSCASLLVSLTQHAFTLALLLRQ